MLYIVGTPIGNLGDISKRALEVLESVDLIAAEDTRNTSGLLMHFNIRKPLVSYFEHNKLERGPVLIEKLKSGENIALVSDAGMPGISDPGCHLISLCINEGLEYTVVPGPCALVTGVVLSGLDTTRFTFEGFLPEDKKELQARLDEFKTRKITTIFYESPHNIVKTMKKLAEFTGERTIALARELTKLHEEVVRGTANELLARFEEIPPRGEYVVVLQGATDPVPEIKDEFNEDAFLAKVKELMDNGQGRNAAIKEAAKIFSLSRNDAYALYEKLS